MDILNISPEINRVRYSWIPFTFEEVWSTHNFKLVKLENKKFDKFKNYWYTCRNKGCYARIEVKDCNDNIFRFIVDGAPSYNVTYYQTYKYSNYSGKNYSGNWEKRKKQTWKIYYRGTKLLKKELKYIKDNYRLICG